MWFFLIVIAPFSAQYRSGAATAQRVCTGIVWVAALLSSLLALERLLP
ncbi:heme exporter protein CcmB [Escherichia coli]